MANKKERAGVVVGYEWDEAPKSAEVDINSREYAFAAAIIMGTPKETAYKHIYSEKTKGGGVVTVRTLKTSSSKLLSSPTVLACLEYLEGQIKKKYTKTKYRKLDMDKLRDKEKLIVEINDDLSAEMETGNRIKLRQQLIDLEQMKKVDVEEEALRPVMYLPARDGGRGAIELGGGEFEVVKVGKGGELDRGE